MEEEKPNFRSALQKMMLGQLDEESLALAKHSREVIKKDPEAAKKENEIAKTKTKRSPLVEENTYTDEEGEPQIDWESEARKKMKNGTANFLPESKSVAEVDSDAIMLLMTGKLNEAKKKKEMPVKTILNENKSEDDEDDAIKAYENPLDQYKGKANDTPQKKQEIKPQITHTELSKADTKALLLEIVMDELIINGRMKKIVKEMLKEILQESKAKK